MHHRGQRSASKPVCTFRLGLFFVCTYNIVHHVVVSPLSSSCARFVLCLYIEKKFKYIYLNSNALLKICINGGQSSASKPFCTFARCRPGLFFCMCLFVCLFVCVPACENEISSAVTETKQAEMRCV